MWNLFRKSTSDENKTKSFELYQSAQQFLSRNEWHKAIELLTGSIKKDPSNAAALNDRGATYMLTGNLDLAIKDLKRAVEIESTRVGYYKNLGEALYVRRKTDEAYEVYLKAEQLQPDAMIYLRLGRCLVEKLWFKDAITKLNLSKELDPDNYETYSLLGEALMNLEDYKQASEEYTRAMELNKNYAASFTGRGSCRANLGEIDGAIEDFSRAFEMNPKDLKPLLARGICYLESKEMQKGLEDLKRVANSGRNVPEAMKAIGIMQDLVDKGIIVVEMEGGEQFGNLASGNYNRKV